MAEGTDYGWMMGYSPVPQDLQAAMTGAAWSESQFAPGGQYNWMTSDPRFSQYLSDGYKFNMMDDGRIALIRGDMDSGGIDRMFLDSNGNTTGQEFEAPESTWSKFTDAMQSAAPYLAVMAAVATGGAALAGAGGGGAGAGALTTEGILGSNYATGSLGGFGSGVAYGAPTTLEGALTAMTGGGVAANTAGMALPAGFEEAGISMEDLLPGGTNAPAGSTVGAATASGVPLGQVGNAWQSAAAAAAQQAAGGSGGSRPPGLPNGGQQQPSGVGGNPDLMKLISGLIGAYQQNNAADKLLARADAATPNRDFYNNLHKQWYENPGSYLQSPEVQAAMDLTLNKLQRQDATKGNNANSTDRQRLMQQYALTNLGTARNQLGSFVNQQASIFSGNNDLFKTGTMLDNSSLNNILMGLNGAFGGNQGVNNAVNTGANWFQNLFNNGFSAPSGGAQTPQLPYIA